LIVPAPQKIFVYRTENRGVLEMDRARQVREILWSRGLTLYRVSRKSAELFGRSSEFYVPHNLYAVLTHTAKIPTICEILALSQITNYQLSDWLRVFGFELDAIFRLRLQIPREQTALLDSTVYDRYAWVPWFAARTRNGAIPPIAPLGELLAAAPPRRAGEIVELHQRKFLYAVVGERDLYALPHFAPGSVVRADPRRSEELLAGRGTVREETFFLVEHGAGWTCSQLLALGRDQILLRCAQRPCLERELKIERDGRILGAIDLEIRPMRQRVPGVWESKPAPLPEQRAVSLLPKETSLPHLLRQSRIRAGLSFREASALSRWLADVLSDELYFAAVSTLSDCETMATPPRKVQKIITLCILYSIGFEQFLRACDLPVDQAGREPIPDELLPRPVRKPRTARKVATPERGIPIQPGFFGALLEQWQEIPLFLRFSLDEIGGLEDLSLSDLFWVGGDPSPRHPLLVNAELIAVNRKARKPPPHAPGVCDRPLHVVLTRGGRYLCGRCSLDRGDLIVAGYPRGRIRAQKFRNGIDAEVAGRVTAILRRIR
jgi:hypothetical protein